MTAAGVIAPEFRAFVPRDPRVRLG